LNIKEQIYSQIEEEIIMSVNTHGITKEVVDAEEILNFIKTKYDTNASMRLDYSKGEEIKYFRATGRIKFNDGDDNRSLFVIVDSVREEHQKGIISSEKYTWLDLGCYGNSVEIMKSIINHFGGWVDDNDCDEEGYYYIPANPDRNVPQMIRVTMQEIYDKFGGIVIITK
jgi:hypothetical protein